MVNRPIKLSLKPFDVVVVPFPFTDRSETKRRPALVLSSAAFNAANEHSVLAMITSADQSQWKGDVPITALAATGLTQACILRMKLFTLDHRLIIRRIGVLSKKDRESLMQTWSSLLPLAA